MGEETHQDSLKNAFETLRAFTWGKGPHSWRILSISEYGRLAKELREVDKRIKGRLHGQQRRDVRIAINNAIAYREKSRIQGRLTSVIKLICVTQVEKYSLNYLRLRTGETTTDLAIHDAHTAHLRQWFLSSPESPNFFSHYEIDWSNPQDSKEEHFMNCPSYLCIPAHIQKNIWNALACSSKV